MSAARQEPYPPAAPPVSWLAPSACHLGAAALLAGLALLLPQEAPLSYYPLNNPGLDLLHLEISCASSVPGQMQIFLNHALGFNELDSIRIPLGASSAPDTYSFPLPDAPLVELRVDPPGSAPLTLRQMRILNGRGEEVRRLTRGDFKPSHEIATVEPGLGGWQIIPVLGATDPYSVLDLGPGLAPSGMNARNLRRCLLSTSYLALLLWLLLLSLHVAMAGADFRRDLVRVIIFLLALALLFSAAANRGLIRNSIRYARFTPPPIAPGMLLEFDLASSGHTANQLFFDIGNGFREADSVRRAYEPHDGLQTVRFPLPDRPLRALRFDPREDAGRVVVRGIRVVDGGGFTRAVLPLDSLTARQEIALLKSGPDQLEVVTVPGSSDPIVEFTPAAVAMVNHALAHPSRP